MYRDVLEHPLVRAALTLLAVATLALTWATVRAVSPQTPAVITASTMDGANALAPLPAHGAADIGVAIGSDLFAPDRAQPEFPYRMPGEQTEVAEAPAPDPIKPVLLGTALIGRGRDFATVTLGDGPPAILRVGDKIGEYTLKTIERTRVVFTTPNKGPLAVPALSKGA